MHWESKSEELGWSGIIFATCHNVIPESVEVSMPWIFTHSMEKVFKLDVLGPTYFTLM